MLASFALIYRNWFIKEASAQLIRLTGSSCCKESSCSASSCVLGYETSRTRSGTVNVPLARRATTHGTVTGLTSEALPMRRYREPG